MVGQVKGDYEAKEEIMTKYLKVVGELVKKFDRFNITQVPRDQNEEADQLARIATGQKHPIPSGVSYQVLDQPSTKLEKIQVCMIDYSNSWADPIVQYLQQGTVPDD